MTRTLRYWNGIRVPWIAPWPSETPEDHGIAPRRWGGPGIGYVNEHHVDRRDGVLWVRVPATPGRGGRPHFAGIHALRQRQAVDRMLCQVCGGPTIGERPDGRYLYLFHSRTGRPIQEGERTAVPPVHESCAREAVQECPHLRRGWTAALVEHAPDWGVAGVLYDPATLKPQPAQEGDVLGLECVPYEDDERLRWTLAARSVVALYGIEEIDVASLASAAGRPPVC